MKRTLSLLLTLALFLQALCLFSCNIYLGDSDGGDFNSTESTKGNVQTSDGTSLSVMELKQYATEKEDYTDEVVSWHDGTYNYYVFKVGQIKNVPLTATYAVYYYDGNGANLTHTESVVQATESTVTASTSQAVKSSVTTKREFEAELELSGKIKIVDADVELGYSQSTSNTNENTWTKSYSECVKTYSETSKTLTLSFNQNSKEGNYLYLLLGNVDVYYAVVQSRTSPDEYSVKTFSKLVAHKYVLNYTGDDDEFAVDKSKKIEVDPSFVLSLPQPEEYIKPEEPKEEPGTQEDPKVFTGYWASEVTVKDASMSKKNGHYWVLHIPDAAALAEAGNNKIKISYEFWVTGGWHIFGGNVDVECYISHTENTEDAVHHQSKASDSDGKWIKGNKTTDLQWFVKEGEVYLILFNENLSESFTVSKVKITAEVYQG